MPHVGIQSLGTGHRQHDITHRHQRQRLVGEQEFDTVERIERGQRMAG
jgi:hypothetical protein